MRTPITKIALLPVFVFAFFVAYTHSLPIAQSILPAGSAVGIEWFIAAVVLEGLALAAVWGLIFAFPLAWLYQRHAVLAAAFCVAPILVVVGQHFGRPASLQAHATLLSFVLPLAVIVPTAARFAYQSLLRPRKGSV